MDVPAGGGIRGTAWAAQRDRPLPLPRPPSAKLAVPAPRGTLSSASAPPPPASRLSYRAPTRGRQRAEGHGTAQLSSRSPLPRSRPRASNPAAAPLSPRACRTRDRAAGARRKNGCPCPRDGNRFHMALTLTSALWLLSTFCTESAGERPETPSDQCRSPFWTTVSSAIHVCGHCIFEVCRRRAPSGECRLGRRRFYKCILQIG